MILILFLKIKFIFNLIITYDYICIILYRIKIINYGINIYITEWNAITSFDTIMNNIKIIIIIINYLIKRIKRIETND